MGAIRPATPRDLNAVAHYLEARLGPGKGVERYRRYFEYPWMKDRENLGFLIEDQGKIGGFVGAIYSERVLNGTKRTFCNINCWSVDEPYRSQSLHLMRALLSRKDMAYTCFSPSERVVELLQFFKFETWTNEKLILPLGAGVARAPRAFGVRVRRPSDEFEHALTETERHIYADHRSYRCGHFLIERGSARCYLVTGRRGTRFRAFADVLYVSDPELLFDAWLVVAPYVALHHATPLLGIDRRLTSRDPWGAFVYRGLRPLQYRGAGLALRDIDTLYSEFVPMFG